MPFFSRRSKTPQSQAAQSRSVRASDSSTWAGPRSRSPQSQAAASVQASRMSRFKSSITSAFSKLRSYLTRIKAPKSQLNNLNAIQEVTEEEIRDIESRASKTVAQSRSLNESVGDIFNQPLGASRKNRRNSRNTGTGLNIPSIIPEESSVQYSFSRESARLKNEISSNERKIRDYHSKASKAYKEGNKFLAKSFLGLELQSKRALEGSRNRLSNLRTLKSMNSRR
jgi:hypothetical protein